MTRSTVTVLVAIALCAAAPAASAHALDIAYLRVEPAGGGANRIVLDLDATAAAHLLGAPAPLGLDALRARAPELAAATYAREAPTTPAGRCTFDPPIAELAGTSVRLSARLACPAGARTWRFAFVADARLARTFELLVKETAADRLTVLDRSTLTLELATPPPAVVALPRPSRPGGSLFLLGGLLVGVMLAPLARVALRRAV